jgi:hypothetical protein
MGIPEPEPRAEPSSSVRPQNAKELHAYATSLQIYMVSIKIECDNDGNNYNPRRAVVGEETSHLITSEQQQQ